MPVPIAAAAIAIGGMALTAITGAIVHQADEAGHAVERDPRASWGTPPESQQGVADTMAEPTNYEQMQHKVMNIPGARIRVRGKIDSHQTLANLRANLGNDHQINDMRGSLDGPYVDDLLSRRAQ